MMRLHLYETWHNRKVEIDKENDRFNASPSFEDSDDDADYDSKAICSSPIVMSANTEDRKFQLKRKISNNQLDLQPEPNSVKRLRCNSMNDCSDNKMDNMESAVELQATATEEEQTTSIPWASSSYSLSSKREYAEVVDIEIETLMTDVSGRVRDTSGMTQQPHMIDTLRRPLYWRIYPSEHPDGITS